MFGMISRVGGPEKKKTDTSQMQLGTVPCEIAFSGEWSETKGLGAATEKITPPKKTGENHQGW